MGLKPNRSGPVSFSALTLLVGSLTRETVIDMIYNVFGGMLNLAELPLWLIKAVVCMPAALWIHSFISIGEVWQKSDTL